MWIIKVSYVPEGLPIRVFEHTREVGNDEILQFAQSEEFQAMLHLARKDHQASLTIAWMPRSSNVQ